VSQHLKVLKEAGLVRDSAAGTRRLYQVDPDGVAAIRTYLDQLWDTALAAFKQAAEQPVEQAVEQPVEQEQE
jgi:DNA-binding transcriptional ArsR family regulator